MTDLKSYWKRVIEFPGIVRRPEDAKLDALEEGGARVLVQQDSQFQRVLFIETPKRELMLLLDGEIQFYSGDEHRFHEALAIVPALYHAEPLRSVGVMGGGDGLVARELLRHFGDELELIRIIDIDPAVTELARTHPRLIELNCGSLLDDRVEVINADALTYQAERSFDLILCDLPDPTSGRSSPAGWLEPAWRIRGASPASCKFMPKSIMLIRICTCPWGCMAPPITPKLM